MQKNLKVVTIYERVVYAMTVNVNLLVLFLFAAALSEPDQLHEFGNWRKQLPTTYFNVGLTALY